MSDLDSLRDRHFGFHDFRPGQREALERVREGDRFLVIMPTGGGKSLIYQLGSLLVEGITIVISPLKSLMKDQVDSMTRHGIPAIAINSAMESEEQEQRINEVRKGRFKVVLVSPERLRNEKFVRALEGLCIGLFAVDEAHCISDWGHDFRPDYRRIPEVMSRLRPYSVVALTATAAPRVRGDVCAHLGMERDRCIVMGFDRPNLFFAASLVGKDEERKAKVLELCVPARLPMIIYAGTRKNTESLAEDIHAHSGIPVRHYHAGLEDHERTAIQDDFMQGKLDLIVATNAFGMGIDRRDVRSVVHYGLPGSMDAYYQEAGRAGRDGGPALACLIWGWKDVKLQEYFIDTAFPGKTEIMMLYQAICRNDGAIDLEELSSTAGIPETRLRLITSRLETDKYISRSDYSGRSFESTGKDLDGEWVDQVVQEFKDGRKAKQALLEEMKDYAATPKCRRTWILDYFGDLSHRRDNGEGPRCCDSCRRLLRSRRAEDTTKETERQAQETKLYTMVAADTAPLVQQDDVPAPADPSVTPDYGLRGSLNRQILEIEPFVASLVADYPGQLTNTHIKRILCGSTSIRIDAFRNDKRYSIFPEDARNLVGNAIVDMVMHGFLQQAGSRYYPGTKQYSAPSAPPPDAQRQAAKEEKINEELDQYELAIVSLIREYPRMLTRAILESVLYGHSMPVMRRFKDSKYYKAFRGKTGDLIGPALLSLARKRLIGMDSCFFVPADWPRCRFLDADLPEAEKRPPTLSDVKASGKSYMEMAKGFREHAYSSWTLGEEEELVRLHNAGKSIGEIAEALNRMEGAIRSRMRRLGY